MTLCIAASGQCEPPSNDVVERACDREKVEVVRIYLQAHFPNRTIHEFHSHSTVVVDGHSPAPCANYHVVSLSDELPDCAVLSSGVLEQPMNALRDHLHRWDLARAIHVNRTVIVGAAGLSSL